MSLLVCCLKKTLRVVFSVDKGSEEESGRKRVDDATSTLVPVRVFVGS